MHSNHVANIYYNTVSRYSFIQSYTLNDLVVFTLRAIKAAKQLEYCFGGVCVYLCPSVYIKVNY